MSAPSTLDLQRTAALAWGFTEREHLGEWEFRAGGGFSHRANSAWPLGDPGVPLEVAVATTAAWYRERGLPPRIQTIAGSELDRRIAELGHPDVDGASLRQTASLKTAYDVLSATARTDVQTEVTKELPADFTTLYRRGAEPHPDAAVVLTSGGAEHRFAEIHGPDRTLLACGRLAVDRVSGWAGLSAIHTAPSARRQGLARVILRDLLATAGDAGAERVLLEVEHTNSAALPLYAALGFTTHHAYHCRLM